MSDYCECSTKDQVVMTDGAGVHRWTGDTLELTFNPMMVGPRGELGVATPDKLANRRPGCGKPVPPPASVGGLIEWCKDGAFWRRYPDGFVTGPHAEPIVPPAAHQDGAVVFVAHDDARLAIERELRAAIANRLAGAPATEGHSDGGASPRAVVVGVLNEFGVGDAAEVDPEAHQRAVLRAELDRKVEPKGGRR